MADTMHRVLPSPVGSTRVLIPLLASALIIGATNAALDGPLPGEIALTRALQTAFDGAPPWTGAVTRTAKMPLLPATVLAASILCAGVAPKRFAVAPVLAVLAALALDKALRIWLYVPRPDPDLVQVLSASASSGLPSTFGLTYASAFSAVFWLPVSGRRASVARIIAATVVAVGFLVRVLPGGHWPSQMIASMSAGAALAYVAVLGVQRASDAAQDKE